MNNFDIRSLDLRKINSITKYPSILTYHGLGEKGCLTEEILVKFDSSDKICCSEKIDGTNSRIILFPNDMYLIGSREELLHAKGDLIYNSTLDIVETTRNVADNAVRILSKSLNQEIMIIFGETYGGKTTNNSKNYSKTGKLGFRIFDIVLIKFQEFEDLLKLPIDKISSWRENNGQKFVDNSELKNIAGILNHDTVPKIDCSCPPDSINETYQWLKNLLPGSTFAGLDENIEGKPEGVVIRTIDRSKIAKIRFEDYERTFRKR